MSHAKQGSTRKRRSKAVPVLGAAGLLSLASGASAQGVGPVGAMPTHTDVSHEITLSEEEVSDVSLCSFDKENTTFPSHSLQLVRGGVAAVTAVVVAVAPAVAVVAVTPVVVVEAAEAAEAADVLEAAPGVEAAVSGGGAEAVVCRGVPAPCANGMNQTVGALASTREHGLTAISLVISGGVRRADRFAGSFVAAETTINFTTNIHHGRANNSPHHAQSL